MSKNNSNQLPVLVIALVTGEEINPEGLPRLRFYHHEGQYILAEGKELIEAALKESVKRGKQPSVTSVSLAVEVISVEGTERRRRTRRTRKTTKEEGGVK